MGKFAAKLGDKVKAIDTHNVKMLSYPFAISMITCPFNGVIDSDVSNDVKIMGKSAAITGCRGTNSPAHLPPVNMDFVVPPLNKAIIQSGSRSVFINNKPAVRSGDMASTCNDQLTPPGGKVVVENSTVYIGD